MTFGITISVMATALSTIVVPSEVRGLYIAVSIAIGALFGVALAPMSVSLLSGAIGGAASIGSALALVCATASLLSAAVFAMGAQFFPQPKRLAPQ